MICGSEHLDFKELESSTKYEDGYTADSPIIKYTNYITAHLIRQFWEVIHELTYEEQKKFLMFITGSDRAPIRGLREIDFVISRNGPDSDT